jgi:hypothetical protein
MPTGQCDSDVVLGCDGAEDCPSDASCCVTLYSTPTGLDSAGTSCVSSCEKSSSTTGSGVIVDSVACRWQGDCAEVIGPQDVPYNRCCWVQGLVVPACVSEDYATLITSQLGGGCF